MTISRILNKLSGLTDKVDRVSSVVSKPNVIRTEPLPQRTIKYPEGKTGFESIVPEEVTTRGIGRTQEGIDLPTGTTEEGIAFGDPSEIAQTHPETYQALAEGASRDISRLPKQYGEKNVDGLLNRLSEYTQKEKELDFTSTTPLFQQVQEGFQSSSQLDTVIGKAKGKLLDDYLTNLKVGATRKKSLLASARANDGGTGDIIASRLIRRVQDEQIANNVNTLEGDRLVATIRASIDANELELQAKVGANLPKIHKKVFDLDGLKRTKATNIALGVVQKQLLTKNNKLKLDSSDIDNFSADDLFGTTTSAVFNAVGKKLIQRMPELGPTDDFIYKANKPEYKNLSKDEKLKANKEWEINLASIFMERLMRDGQKGYLFETKSFPLMSKRQELNVLKAFKFKNDSKFRNVANKLNAKTQQQIANIDAQVANGTASPLIKSIYPKLDTPKKVEKRIEKLEKEVGAGKYDPWELKPTPLFERALKGFKDAEQTGADANFSGKPTVSHNLDDIITYKSDLEEDLLHFNKNNVNSSNAPILFQAINKLQSTQFNIDQGILDELDALSRASLKDSNGNDISFIPKQGSRDINGEIFDAEDIIEYQRLNDKSTEYKLRGPFRFNNWIDFRGRIGYNSAYINPQGDAFSRAMLTANKKVSNQSKEWDEDLVNEMLSYWDDSPIKVGGPKLSKPLKEMSLDEKMKFWEDNKSDLLNFGGNWSKTHSLWRDLDSKDALAFLKAAKELKRKHIDGDKVSGYMTGLDALTSQAQMVAAAFKDKNLGSYVGLTSSKPVDDLYEITANDMWSVFRQDNKAEGQVFLTPKAISKSRKLTKRPYMTETYNAGETTMAEQLIKDAKDIGIKLNEDEADYFIETMSKVLKPGSGYAASVPFESVGAIKNITKNSIKYLVKPKVDANGNRIYAKDANGNLLKDNYGNLIPEYQQLQKPGQSFKSKSGFPFRQLYRDSESNTVDTRIYRQDNQGTVGLQTKGKIAYSVPLEDPSPTSAYNARKRMQISFTPNLIHSFDADVLHHTIKNLDDMGVENIMTVHDQFFVEAGKGHLLRTAYVKALQDVFSGNRVREILEQRIDKADVDKLMKNYPQGTLDLSDLDNILKDYNSKNISPVNVG